MTDCTYPRHGSRAAYLDGCRCPESRRANTDYQTYRERRLARAAFGADDPFSVPVEDTASVLAQLRGIGWSKRRVEAVTGIGRDHLCRIEGLTGRPISRVRYSTHKRLVALLERGGVDYADGALVDASDTWRRIHGLMALGYPKTWIAQQIGVGRALQFNPYLITVANAEKVKDLANRYATTPGPSDAARRYAAARGWTADLLWEDEPLLPGDVPEASDEGDVDWVTVDRFVNGDNQIRLTRDERWAVYQRLRATGVTHNQAAIRLKMSGGYSKVYLDRYDTEAVSA